MKTTRMAEAGESPTECVKRVAAEPLIAMANGEPLAVLVPVENADPETVSLSVNP